MIVTIHVYLFASDTNDFQLQSNQIIILPGMVDGTTLVCQTITILGDIVEEGNETFTITASVASPGDITSPDTFTVTILDDGDGMSDQ